MKRYNIELNEDQLLLVANCLEDISRFASGQCEMRYTIGKILHELSFDEKIKRRNCVEKLLKKSKGVLLPNIAYDVYKGYDSSEFIGNTYQIYRSILHQLAIDNNWNNVYSSPSLPSGNMGEVKIKLISKNNI